MNATAFDHLIAAFERLKIRYSVVGSVASSAHGLVRGTLDIDILAAVGPGQAAALAAALGNEWYADEQEIGDSIRRGRSFNLIHIRTGEKFDIFPATDEFHASELSRAADVLFPFPEGPVRAKVCSAEDALLAKLQWINREDVFRIGNGGTSQEYWLSMLFWTSSISGLGQHSWEWRVCWTGRSKSGGEKSKY